VLVVSGYPLARARISQRSRRYAVAPVTAVYETATVVGLASPAEMVCADGCRYVGEEVAVTGVAPTFNPTVPELLTAATR
jgi:hypothetical protein